MPTIVKIDKLCIYFELCNSLCICLIKFYILPAYYFIYFFLVYIESASYLYNYNNIVDYIASTSYFYNYKNISDYIESAPY